MQNTSRKRPWTKAEKSLFLSPLLVLIVGAAIWWRQHPTFISFGMQVQSVHVRFSPDSKRLLAIEQLGTLATVYDVESGRKLTDLQIPYLSRQYAPPSWSPDGNRIATGFHSGNYIAATSPNRIAIWDAMKGTMLSNWSYAPPGEKAGAGVQYSRDGSHLIGTGFPSALFDARTGQRVVRFKSSFKYEFTRRLNPNEDLIAFVGGSNPQTTLEVRDTNTNAIVWSPQIKCSEPTKWSQRNVLCALIDNAQNKRELWLWDGNTRRRLSSPPAAYIYSMAPSGVAPVVAYAQGEWTTTNQNEPRTLKNTIHAWNYETGKEVWNRPAIAPQNLSWSPDGNWLSYRETSPEGKNTPERFIVVNAQGQEAFQTQVQTSSTTQWSPNSKLIAIPTNKGVQIIPIA